MWFNKLKRYFLTGLLVILPITIAIWLLYTVFIFASGFAPIIALNLEKYTHYNFNNPVIYTILRALTIIFLLILIFCIGFITTRTIGKKLADFWEYLLKKIPIVSKIYNFFKQIIDALMNLAKTNNFKGVALIEYPYKGSYSLAFVINDAPHFIEENQNHYSVFMPTLPNPTTGFLIMMPKSEVIIVDIPIEHVIKIMFSCGIIDIDSLNESKKE